MRCRPALLLVLAAALAGEESVLRLTLPDLARTRERWATNPLGQVPSPELPSDQALAQAISAAIATATAGEARVQLVDGRPVPEARLRLPDGGEALRAAVGEGPVPLRTVEGWLHVGEPSGPWAGPAALDADVRLEFDPAPLGRLSPEGADLLAATGLGALELSMIIGEEGTREVGTLVWRDAPLKPIDPAVLGGVNDDALFVLALGIDGRRFGTWFQRVVAAGPGGERELRNMQRSLERAQLPALTELLAGFDGTIWIAVAPGVPFPTVTVAVPASPQVDALMAMLAQELQFDAQAARTAPVPIQGIPRQLAQLMPTVRRGGRQWILTTDMVLADAYADATGGTLGATGLAMAVEPCAVYRSNNPVILRTILGFLPMVAAQARGNPEAAQAFAATQKVLMAALPHLPVGRGWATATPAGLRLEGDNLMISSSPLAIVAGMLIPAVTLVRAKAQQTASANNARQLVTAGVAWSVDHDGAWPADLATLMRDTQLPDAVASRRGSEHIPGPHYLYVRPALETASYQPVIVEDIRLGGRQGMVVCMADSSVRVLRGDAAQRVWAEAQRLAMLPKAATTGIETTDWAAVEDVLTGR